MKFTNKNKRFFVIIAKVFLCFNLINGTAQKDLQKSTEEAKKCFLNPTLEIKSLSDAIEESEFLIECFKNKKSCDSCVEGYHTYRCEEIKTFLKKYETFASLEEEKAKIVKTLKKLEDSKKAYDDLETSSNQQQSLTNEAPLSEFTPKEKNLTATDIARQECRIRDFLTKKRFEERNKSFQNRIKVFENNREGMNPEKTHETQKQLRIGSRVAAKMEVFENKREGMNPEKTHETQKQLNIDSGVADKIKFFQKAAKSNGRVILGNEYHTSLPSKQELPQKTIHNIETDGTIKEEKSLAENRRNILVKHRDFTTSEIDNMLNECLTHKNFFIKRFKSHNILLGYIRSSAETTKQVNPNPQNFNFTNSWNFHPRDIATKDILSLLDDRVKPADTNKEDHNEMVSYIKIANNVNEQLKEIEKLVEKNVNSYNHDTFKPLSTDEELLMVELKKIINYLIQTTRGKSEKAQEIVYAGWIENKKFFSYTDNKDKRAFS